MQILNADPDSTYHPDADPDSTYHPDAYPRIQILASNKGSNHGKRAKIGSYYVHFGLSSAN
jgi:hypothetical protein